MSGKEIERLAQAYVDEMAPPGTAVSDFDREGVRAILQALREPSEGMMAANLAARTGPWVTPLGFWQAMIDHLLSDSD